ncbi:hypothetical protein HK102_008024 [Quaeritorhiza haematococci]|nr:hypothetical protein HK102_008024 [Quaeritorhiza haematococci]
MGNSVQKPSVGSSGHGPKHEEEEVLPSITIDGGQLMPFGVYPTAPVDWDVKAVRRLIVERKIAPFYKGLPDEPEPDTLVQQHMGKLSMSTPSHSSTAELHSSLPSPTVSELGGASSFHGEKSSRLSFSVGRQSIRKDGSASHDRHGSSSSLSSVGSTGKGKRSMSALYPTGSSSSGPSEAAMAAALGLDSIPAGFKENIINISDLYKDAVECPICFLHFGVIYAAPRSEAYKQHYGESEDLQTGNNSTAGTTPSTSLGSSGNILSSSVGDESFTPPPSSPPLSSSLDSSMAAKQKQKAEPKKRRKSLSHKNEIRPDWHRKQQQLMMQQAANQARRVTPYIGPGGVLITPARRRNYTIDDPELATTAAAAAALVESMNSVTAAAAGNRSSSRHRHGSASGRDRERRDRSGREGRDLGLSYLEAVRNMGADLEELMIMEAVRRSLVDNEQQESPEGESAPEEPPTTGTLELGDTNDTRTDAPQATQSPGGAVEGSPANQEASSVNDGGGGPTSTPNPDVA